MRPPYQCEGSLSDLSIYMDSSSVVASVENMVIDAQPQLDMPGGDDFFDVTRVFADAATELEPGEVLLMDGYDLQQAMAVLEIGDPKLDSGMTLEGQVRPKFDPMMPLLPEELCWIMDRSLAYEMQWHAGNSLSHTIYTLCYVHHLPEIDPDSIHSRKFGANSDASRPTELVTVLLRSYVMGLLKCCDLSWRELNNNAVREIEDWQSDKCDVSLQEGVPCAFVISKLEQARAWIAEAAHISSVWREAILHRIMFRTTILHLLGCDMYKDPPRFQAYLDTAQAFLQAIRSHPAPEPAADSPAHLAFDPFIARFLAAYVPVCIVEVPPFAEVCAMLSRFLNGWGLALRLSKTNLLRSWEIAGDLGRYRTAPLAAYLRSSIQNMFYNGVFILNNYTLSWVVDRFFSETLGVRYGALRERLTLQWTGTDPPPWQDMERLLTKLIIPHIRANWANIPRHRRILTKSLVGWHKLYDILVEISFCHRTALSEKQIVTVLPMTAQLWRLNAIREVVLSGFQLELYAPEEKPFAYWYIIQVISKHLEYMENVRRVVPQDSPVIEEMDFQSQLLTGVQLLCRAVFIVLNASAQPVTKQTEANFIRRYKWAFQNDYNSIASPIILNPRLDDFVASCAKISKDETASPAACVEQAYTVLTHLAEANMPSGWAGDWSDERRQFVRLLVDACSRLDGLPTSVSETHSFVVRRLIWDPAVHIWFPSLRDPAPH